MKKCSYCGHDCLDNAASCSGCGTEFAAPLKESPGGPFHRPPRPEAGSIVLKNFAQEAPAQLALATLRAARIEAFVATDDCGGLYPSLNAGSPFRLIVSEVHREAAEQVLADKKQFYTNGILREELLDRNRDGTFDEKLSFDVYGVEVKKEKLN